MGNDKGGGSIGEKSMVGCFVGRICLSTEKTSGGGPEGPVPINVERSSDDVGCFVGRMSSAGVGKTHGGSWFGSACVVALLDSVVASRSRALEMEEVGCFVGGMGPRSAVGSGKCDNSRDGNQNATLDGE